MPKVARCKDTGLNCEFIIKGETEEELLENASEHVDAAHPTLFAQSQYKGFGAEITQDVVAGMAGNVGSDQRRDWLAMVSEAAQDE